MVRLLKKNVSGLHFIPVPEDSLLHEKSSILVFLLGLVTEFFCALAAAFPIREPGRQPVRDVVTINATESVEML